MIGIKTYASALAVVLALAGTTVAVGGGRWNRAKGPGELKHLGLKAYWSVLHEDQKESAKAILADHLATVAPDRMATAARLLTYRANVAAALTKEQRIQAADLLKKVGELPAKEKWVLVDRRLGTTDRAALADRVEALEAAGPEARVDLGSEILDQVFEAVEAELAEQISLTAEQRRTISGLRAGLKTDLRPLAIRLATAREETKQKAMALLDSEQRTRLEDLGKGIRARILSFIRG